MRYHVTPNLSVAKFLRFMTDFIRDVDISLEYHRFGTILHDAFFAATFLNLYFKEYLSAFVKSRPKDHFT